MEKWTPEPWTKTKISMPGQVILNLPGQSIQVSEKNADKILSCVNACESLNPEAVPELIEVCKMMIEWHELGDTNYTRSFERLKKTLKKLEEE